MKIGKRLLGLALACIMVMGLSTTTFAADPDKQAETVVASENISPRAGTETWTPGERSFGSIHLTNYNLTPVKTMSTSGTLYVYGYYRTTDGRSRAVLTTEIRKAYSNTVLASGFSVEGYSTGQRTYYATGVTHVNRGDQVQIFTDISSLESQPAGSPYRKADVDLYYKFVAD